MSQETTEFVCYSTWGTPAMTTECGKSDYIQCCAVLSLVTCPACLKSLRFQEHLILKEIGCNGNWAEFYELLKNSVITD